jgi:putative transposase
VLRALALLRLDAGLSAPKVAQLVPFTAQAIRVIAKRYREEGLERALFEKKRPGHAELLQASDKQRIIAMACSQPPEGRSRWTVRLIAEEAVKRKLVPGVGRETIRILLQSHDLKPWRKKMWCIAALDEEYITKMEDVLAVYIKPYRSTEPVLCLDEKPVSLHADVRPFRPARQLCVVTSCQGNGTSAGQCVAICLGAMGIPPRVSGRAPHCSRGFARDTG